MPRRLGDDPLRRAKSARTPTITTSHDGVGTEAASSHFSYNDVFFRRRGEAINESAPAKTAPNDAPEITEISQIPEIREAAATPATEAPIPTQTLEVVDAPAEGLEPTAQAEPIPLTSPVLMAMTEAAPTAAASVATEPSTPAPVEGAPRPQKSGGFLKRLLGKFK